MFPTHNPLPVPHLNSEVLALVCCMTPAHCDQVVSGPFRMDREGRRKRGESVELSTHNSAGRTPGQN